MISKSKQMPKSTLPMESSETILLKKAYDSSQAGNFSEAENICLEAVAKSPFNAVAWSALGVISLQQGQIEVAIQRLQRSIECDPRDWATLLLMVQASRSVGRIHQAAEYAGRALRLRSNDTEALQWVAICSIEIGAFLEADRCLVTLRNQTPERIEYTFLHAQALFGLGRDLVALHLAEICVADQPTEDYLCLLLKIQAQLNRFDDVIATCRTLLDVNSQSPIGHFAKASALTSLGQIEAAETAWRDALACSPVPLTVHLQIGYAYQQLGYFDKAEHEFKRVLEQQENNGEALYAIFSQRKVNRTDIDLIDNAQAALRSAILPPDHDRKYLNYALGKAFHDLGNYAMAMGSFDEANRILRATNFGSKTFDPQPMADRIHSISRLFATKLMAEKSESGSSSELPIFVVGIMRSGTTLVHQILTSHSEMGGAGDLAYWTALTNRFVDYDLGTLHLSELANASSEYEDLLRCVAPGAKHVVDKNPANLFNLGLIHLAFPKAKIICVRRRDIDVAMSLWATPLESDAPFLGDREAIVSAIRQTDHMIQHWKLALPKETFMEICYEDLVDDIETNARRMIDFCGLEWEDTCIHPEANPHLVRTPSFWQVRQKVHSNSVNRYKHYEPWLGPFKQLIPLE